MRFGPLPLSEATGAVLAHSMQLRDGKLAKGTVLDAAALARLAAAGIGQVIAARLDATDLPEDAAAERLGVALAPDPAALGLERSAPFTGRLNLYAAGPGLLSVDAGLVGRLNALDEAVTLATLPDATWVAARQMVATVKIIPYAAPGAAVTAGEAVLAAAGPAMRVREAVHRSAGLVLTVTPGMKPTVVDKGAEAVRTRLAALGVTLAAERRVAHETQALAGAMVDCPGDVLLVLTASATSDRADVGPAALAVLGGTLTRFGMPVDPGNLLYLGRADGRPVIGLPGCARSPKLNGADWVLERVVAGVEPSAAEIAAMGVGGLLKEIPARPQPRGGATAAGARRPRVSALLMAAGASRRMGGRDKLVEDAAGRPAIRVAAEALAGSGADEVIVVLAPGNDARRAALEGLAVRVIENPRAAEGMGTSLAAGMAAIDPVADAVLVALADMPDLEARDHARLIAGFDPEEGREIVRAAADDGTPGHPVLFGRRFF
ncbi:MAG: molybdopterin-binding/glycosyltransferase family 2 protein, partial [Pseudomonadota bacterium]